MILKDKRLLIVGVRNRRSIAYAIARSAMAQGAKLAFTIQPGEKSFRKTASILEENFPDAAFFACDVASDESIQNAVSESARALGGIDGLVHGVAFAARETIEGHYHEGINRTNYAEALDISSYSLTALCKAMLPHFRQTGSGSVVTLSYLGAQRALPSYNVMGIAKAALEASVRYLAFGLGADQIRVNAVSAGPIKTLAALGIDDFGKILKQVEQQAPLKRNISADEVADTVAFLLSDMARGITGETLHVDAGFNITAGF